MLDTETACVVLPLGQHTAVHLARALIEAVAVAHARRVEHAAVALVLCQQVHHVTIGDDDQIEGALAAVVEGLAVVGVVLAAIVAHELLHHHALAHVAGKHAGSEAVLLVEDFVQAHAVGVLGRVDEVAHQHTHVAGTLCLQDFVENQLEVGIAGITDARCALVDVTVLQELVHRVLVGVDAVVHDVDFDLAAGREVVDEVIDGLLELAAATSLVIGVKIKKMIQQN